MLNSSSKVVVITGVSGGIGLATARLFYDQGWIVVGTVRSPKKIPGIDIQPAEMTKPQDLTRLIAHVTRTYGRLDALVCNAGYGLIGPLDTLSYAQMRDQLAVNVLAPAELTRLALPLLTQSSGVAVAVSSIVGRTGLPGYSLYAASKHALEGLYESLSLEYAGRGVRFKLIEPSGVNTGFWSGLKRGNGRSWDNAELGRSGTETVRADHGLTADQVAASVFRAATDQTERLRYPLGQTASLMIAKRFLPEAIIRRILIRVNA